jgi:hypothetical protein
MPNWKQKSIDFSQLLIVAKALLKLQEFILYQKLHRAKQQFTAEEKNAK